MSQPSPLKAPEHILSLLTQLHKTSLDQEAQISSSKQKVFSADLIHDLQTSQPTSDPKAEFDRLMLDKFIALDEDKCLFMYQLLLSMGATNVVEAGTSFGVSTIYLALAVRKNKRVSGKEGVVIATEKESAKANVARDYWKQCGEDVERQIDLREGDLLETLKSDLPSVDFLLLDSRLCHIDSERSVVLTLNSLVSPCAAYTEAGAASDAQRCCCAY